MKHTYVVRLDIDDTDFSVEATVVGPKGVWTDKAPTLWAMMIRVEDYIGDNLENEVLP